MKQGSTVRLNLNMDASMHGRFQVAAESEGRSMSDVVRQLIAQWLRDAHGGERDGKQ